MKRYIVTLLFVVIFACSAFAQKTVKPVIYTIGAPSTCIRGYVYIDSATGFIYTYKTGVGCFLISSGSSSTSINGQTALAADVAISSTSFADVTGLSVTLPSAGTYLITAIINTNANCASGCATNGPDLYFQLFNSTDSASISSSQIRVADAVAAQYWVRVSNIANIITVAASKVIIVQAKRSSGTYIQSLVTGTTADGISRINYIKLN